MIGIQMGDENHECSCSTNCFGQIHYLVINRNKGSQSLRFSEQFRVFTSKPLAIQHAKSIGYEDSFIPVSDHPGIASLWKAGDVDVMVIPLRGE